MDSSFKRNIPSGAVSQSLAEAERAWRRALSFAKRSRIRFASARNLSINKAVPANLEQALRPLTEGGHTARRARLSESASASLGRETRLCETAPKVKHCTSAVNFRLAFLRLYSKNYNGILPT